MPRKKIAAAAFLIFALLGFSGLPVLSGQGRLNEELLNVFGLRNLGPFRCGSWVTDFAVPDQPERDHLYTFYVATRNGGLWKTVNNGTTFTALFDDQPRLSIGAVAVASSNPDVVWVGTGEAHCARSSNHGDGVYRSLDGGRTWKNMGLVDSQHVARIRIHPQNPDIVYVAAMGHLFSPNRERGIFKTADGGKTWENVLFISERVGAVDLVLNPANPDILYAAAYEKERLPWHFEEGGPGSGIYKSADAGKTWTRLAGGLPSGKIGRIGLDIFRKNPDILYAVVENANPRPASTEEAARDKLRGLAPQARTIGGEIYRSADAGKTWTKMNDAKSRIGSKAPYSFNQLRVDPADDQKLYVTGVTLAFSADGGRTWRDDDWPPSSIFAKGFGDVRTLWIDPRNPERIFMGSDGGVHISYDGGKTCDHLYNLPLGEFYAVGVDLEDPYNLYGGLQDHDSWKGPSNGWSGEIGLADWITVGISDGMYNVVDPADSRWVFNDHEFGGLMRIDQKLGTMTDIQPRRPQGQEPYRFNWTPPLHLSPHNGAILYAGAQVLLRSLDRGDHWQEISPDLTTNDRAKLAITGGSISFCTITTISESPLQPGLIWVGTDDGKVQVTRNGGSSWQDLSRGLAAAGAPAPFWVSRVFASPHAAGTAYAAKTGFRNDDDRPLLFKTTDFGQTWTPISAGLPQRCVNAVIEDARKPGLLFAGTDGGVYLSPDGGLHWLYLKGNMPRVKVTDLLIHPRESDLVVATYGRGLFIGDMSVLRELDEDVLAQAAFLFSIKPKTQRVTAGWGNYGLLGDRHLSTPNESEAVVIPYYLKEKGEATVTIADLSGRLLRKLTAKGNAGLNVLFWDMRLQKEGPEYLWPLVEPGEYGVTLEAAGKKLTRQALIKGRSGWSLGPHPLVIK